MRASRHNGRKGKNGVYDVKHNDREFNVEHSEHIDAERAKQNVYWDCYQGYSFGESGREERRSFTQVESEFYYDHYWEHVQEQNRRNEEARHGERNRSVEDLLKNSKTCPEESLLQLGNIDRSVPASVLAKVAAEFFEEFERRYGSHVHILDWALHLDEGTLHIHERHVFDAKNRYGELCPQQEKALEELGFELPDPTKKKGKYNNRKMSFDAECRRAFLEIAQRNGVQVECEPIYGGATYLEKQDFIIENQKRRLEEKQAELQEITMKVADMESFVEEIAEAAYEKACETVTEDVVEQTGQENLKELQKYKQWITAEERKLPKEVRSLVGRCMDTLEKRFRDVAGQMVRRVKEALRNPKRKEAAKEEIKQQARISVKEKLAKLRKETDAQKSEKRTGQRKKREEELT